MEAEFGTFASMEKREILDAISQGLKKTGLTDAEASMRAVGNPHLITNIKRKRYGLPSVENLAALAEVLRLDFHFGPPRAADAEPVLRIADADYAAIPRLDVELSAGDGASAAGGDELGRLAFRRDWLARIGVPPRRAVLVGIRGDSMAPRLSDGDLALIDRGRRTPRPGRAFAFTDVTGDTRVKYIERVGEVLLIRSENTGYGLEIRSGGDLELLKIHGQVVWSGHLWER
ncbi:MAG: helix-turn-helix transcriptional regulator [Gemmobacter sp.]